MKSITLTLILIAALYNVLPTGSPIRPLFDLDVEDPNSGDVPTSDPESDPVMIVGPPPR